MVFKIALRGAIKLGLAATGHGDGHATFLQYRHQFVAGGIDRRCIPQAHRLSAHNLSNADYPGPVQCACLGLAVRQPIGQELITFIFVAAPT